MAASSSTPALTDLEREALKAVLRNMLDETEADKEQELRAKEAHLAQLDSNLKQRAGFLDRKEKKLQDWEQDLNNREMANKHPCDWCHAGVCCRDTPCSRHGHHSCAPCHRAWKTGLPKGDGSGKGK